MQLRQRSSCILCYNQDSLVQSWCFWVLCRLWQYFVLWSWGSHYIP